MELQKESLRHHASQCGCARKPRLVKNHQPCGPRRSPGMGFCSHLHRALNWEKSSQGCICCSPRKCACASPAAPG